jgi:hypothetical protein
LINIPTLIKHAAKEEESCCCGGGGGGGREQRRKRRTGDRRCLARERTRKDKIEPTRSARAASQQGVAIRGSEDAKEESGEGAGAAAASAARAAQQEYGVVLQWCAWG